MFLALLDWPQLFVLHFFLRNPLVVPQGVSFWESHILFFWTVPLPAGWVRFHHRSAPCPFLNWFSLLKDVKRPKFLTFLTSSCGFHLSIPYLGILSRYLFITSHMITLKVLQHPFLLTNNAHPFFFPFLVELPQPFMVILLESILFLFKLTLPFHHFQSTLHELILIDQTLLDFFLTPELLPHPAYPQLYLSISI